MAKMLSLSLQLLLALLVVIEATSGNGSTVYPVGDIRNCPTERPTNANAPLLRMEVLPGLGFDNLRNLDMSLIAQRNYSQCKITNDGRFLVPDDVLVIPLHRSRFETFATFYDHWDNYTSMDSFSINVGASVFSVISGKFGFEYQHVKQHQYNDEGKTTRTQLRNNLYKIVLQPDSQFDVKFKNRLLDIAANLQSNNTFYASFLADLLVRDYGTHMVRSVEAGAIASRIDTISNSYVNTLNSDTSKITASASGSFFKSMFSVSVSTAFSHSSSDNAAYSSSLSHSQIVSIGGPPLRPNMTIEDWTGGLEDNLVAIDRAGEPLHYFITPDSLPELPSPTLREVVNYVYLAVQRYYRVNTHYGCTDPSSPNFNYDANLNDDTCAVAPTNYTFGGVYQTCEVDPSMNYEDLCAKGAAQPNPLTGDYSCPPGYTEIELHSGTVTGTSQKEVCHKVCHHCHLFGWGRCCQCLSAWINVMSAATYQAYWCVAEGKVKANNGFMFGGVYTPKSVNPVTNSMSCPNHFYPLHIGENMEVCVSSEYELGYAYSIPFGGFQSCQAGNPLAANGPLPKNASLSGSNSPKQCPKTYKKVLATVDEHCEINYCAKLRSTHSISEPIRPPYRTKPILKKNLTQSLVIQGAYGQLWVKTENGDWVEDQTQMMTGDELLRELGASATAGGASIIIPTGGGNNANSGISSVASAMISVVVTIFFCTLVIVAIFGVYGLWKRSKQRNGRRLTIQGRSNNTYLEIEEEEEGSQSDQSAPAVRNPRGLVTSYLGINGGDEDDEPAKDNV